MRSLVLLALLAVQAKACATSFDVTDFTSASQINNAGGLTFNGPTANATTGTLNDNSNDKQAGNFFFNTSVDATTAKSFSAFYDVIYDTSDCEFGDCDDGAALILQTQGPSFFNGSSKWGIDSSQSSFAVGFENWVHSEYVVDDGKFFEATANAADYYYQQAGSLHVYTWVDYLYSTKTLDVYVSGTNNKATAVHPISLTSFDIFGPNDLNGASQYYVGIGASTGFYFFQGSDQGDTNEGHQMYTMWFNACVDAGEPCIPTVFTGPLVSFSGSTTAVNPSELKTCRIVESFGLLTGYSLTANGSPVCCTQTGLVSGSYCEISACGITVSSSPNYATSDSFVCFADTVCYTQGCDNANADAIPVYNGTALSGHYSLTVTGPKKTSVFIQKPSGAVSAAFQITLDANGSEYGCSVKGSYSGGSCSQTLCGTSYPIGGYSDYLYDQNGNCYVGCIRSS